MSSAAEKEKLLTEKKDSHGSAGIAKRRRTRRYVCVLVILLLLCVVATFAVITPLVLLKKDAESAPSGSQQFAHAAVAADSGLCSEAGADILRMNGSAVDAAIAAMLCIGVVNSHSAGLGGGAFILVYKASTRQSEVIDCRERAPAAAERDMFVDDPMKAVRGGLAVAVPGELRGMRQAWINHGDLDWKDLFQPAIRIARDGYEVSPAIASAIRSSRSDILNDPGLRAIYTKADNTTLLVEGDTVHRPQLAQTLETLSEDPDTFYTGSMAQQIVDDVVAHGGIMTLQDLADYAPITRDTINITLTEPDICVTAPPPSSGVISNLILDLLHNFNTSQWESSPEYYQRLVEAMKFAYGQRLTLGDPAFDSVVNQTFTNITDPRVVQAMFERIRDNVTFDPDYYINWWGAAPSKSGTSHISVLAANGDAAAVTTTINTYFGAKIRSPMLGLIYNNEMDDFSTPNTSNVYGFPPSAANFIAPGKRPMSSMSPTIIVARNGTMRLVVGASGGSYIISAVAQTVANQRFLDLSIGDAIEKRRVHHQLIPNVLEIETGFPADIQTALEVIHNTTMESSIAVVQGIAKLPHTIEAACDSRKGGYPAGY